MAAAVVYATFFNDKLTLRDALSLDADSIIKKFETIANNADAYQVLDDARPYMMPGIVQIRAIHERYKTHPEPHPGCILSSTGELSMLPISYQGHVFNVRTLYDIVAWILSVVGPVPDTATKENYYYPLMILGYAFCAKLIPKGPKPVTTSKDFIPIPGPPTVWAVMWFRQMVGTKEIKRVIVGATLDQPGEIAKDDAKNFRKNLLYQNQILGLNLTDPSIEQRHRAEAQDFGHCAETYPLLFIFSLAKGKEGKALQATAEGLAANASLAYQNPQLQIQPFAKAKGALLNPCQNCEWLLAYGEGIDIAKFLVRNRKF